MIQPNKVNNTIVESITPSGEPLSEPVFFDLDFFPPSFVRENKFFVEAKKLLILFLRSLLRLLAAFRFALAVTALFYS